MKKVSISLTAFSLLFLLAAGLMGSNLKSFGKMSDFLQEILMKLKSFNESTPEDKTYIHSDKPFYKPGETVWFAVYVRNGKDLKPSLQSDIVKVEIVNPKGAVEKTLQIIAKEGVAQGDYVIDANAMGGLYKLRAFTSWMENDPSPAIFEKEIQVQAVILPRLKMKLDFQKDAYGAGAEAFADLTLNTNANQPLGNYAFNYVVNMDGQQILKEKATTNEQGAAVIKFNLPEKLETHDGLLNVMIEYQGQTEAISRSVPIVLNQIEMKFYPEGGDMVGNVPNRVGFAALNEFGKPADVEGYVTDKSGTFITNFSSFHKGMGAFSFTPQAEMAYIVHLTQPRDIAVTYDLPEALPRGYVLKVEKTEKENIKTIVYSTEDEQLSLVALVHGQQYFAHSFAAHKGENVISIPTSEMPIGLAQLTIFDSKGIARAERMTFVNKHKQLQVELTTDKEKYLPREKVNLTVKVKDERGMPMPANLSLSVVNDQLLSFADDKSSNILSWMLVEGELKGKVEEPNFYFDPKEEQNKRELALDYLLMTAGWRRYTWKEMLSEQPRIMTHAAQKAEIAGIIYGQDGQPLKDATVTLEGQFQKTNESGRYAFKGYTLEKPIYLNVTKENHSPQNIYINNYGTQFNAYLYNQVQVENLSSIRPTTTNMAVGTTKGGGIHLSPKKAVAKKMEAMPGQAAPAMHPVPPAPEAAPQVVDMIIIDDNQDDMGGAAVLDDEDEGDFVAANIHEDIPNKELAANNINRNGAKDVAEMGKVRDERFRPMEEQGVKKPMPNQLTQYYRAKQFASPLYVDAAEPPAEGARTDFRSTLYWNGNVVTDRTGKTVLSFYTSDEITSFRITAEGISTDGMVGRSEKVFFSQLPFSLSAKMPVEVVTEDVVKIPLTLVNNMDRSLTGNLNISIPEGLQAAETLPTTLTLNPKEAKTVYLKYNVIAAKGNGKFSAKFSGKGFNDAFSQDLKIISKGFPVKMAASGSEEDKTFNFDIKNVVQGSQTVTFTAFPSTVSEILKGLEGMLQEPSGCFEQTSSTTYPNILVLQYLNETGQANPELVKRAKELISRGYSRLAGYESKSGGFEWFGGDPAHEGLTAYGLMEFMDMSKVWDGVDSKMMTRTAEWLMKRRDGKGLFERNPRALHEFGLTDNETMSTYIVWALSEFRQQGIEKELQKCYDIAMEGNKPYALGLISNAMFNYGRKKEGEKALAKLLTIQNKEGAWKHNDNDRSAPGSSGQGLAIESASLALMAMMKSESPDMMNIRKVAEFIRTSRNSYGSFGNTNSTVLALRALIKYAAFSKRTDESGKIEISVDGKKVAEKAYAKGEQNSVVIDGLAQFVGEGKKEIRIKYIGVKNPLPYSLSIEYNTALPNSNAECVVKLDTKLANTSVKVGETARLNVTLTNIKAEGQPMTIAIVGLPAGLSPQPWQLKELKEKGTFDFYEVTGNNLVLYYRQMKPSEVRKIAFDLKADIAGNYAAPASCAYLYYTNEFKNWTAMEKVAVSE